MDLTPMPAPAALSPFPLAPRCHRLSSPDQGLPPPTLAKSNTNMRAHSLSSHPRLHNPCLPCHTPPCPTPLPHSPAPQSTPSLLSCPLAVPSRGEHLHRPRDSASLVGQHPCASVSLPTHTPGAPCSCPEMITSLCKSQSVPQGRQVGLQTPGLGENPPDHLPCHRPDCPNCTCGTQPCSKISSPWLPRSNPLQFAGVSWEVTATSWDMIRDRLDEVQGVEAAVNEVQLKVQTFTGTGINEHLSGRKEMKGFLVTWEMTQMASEPG